MVAASAWRARAGGSETVTRRHLGPAGVAALGGASLASCESPGPIVVAADARLVRKDELARTLADELGRMGASENRRPSPPREAELILAAYRAWGTDCPDRLLGDFAFALWDGGSRTLFCARDPAGVRPLHYTRNPDGVVRVASDAGQLLATGVPRVLDGFYLLDFLIGNFREQARSPWAEIRRLSPGHCLVADDRGLRGRRYWHPERGTSLGRVPSWRSDTEWVQAFRELLETVVVDHLGDAGEAAALMTSGGVDSSIVAAFAERLFQGGRIDSRPLAVIETFERLEECDESEYSTLLVEETGIDAERIVVDDLSDLARDHSWGGPADSPASLTGELTSRVLSRVRARGSRMIATGFGGDSLFDAARWQTFDWVRQGRWRRVAPWIVAAHERGASWPKAVTAYLLPPLLTYRGRRRLDRLRGQSRYWQAPEWLHPQWQSLARRRLGDQAYPLRYRNHARRRQYEHIVGLGQQGRAIEWWSTQAARRGLELRLPLLDRRLAELVLVAPLELGARPGAGGSKWLLREAAAGVVPERIRLRADKGSWAAHTQDAVCRRMAGILRARFDGRSPLAGLSVIRDRALIESLEEYCDSGRGGAAAGHLITFAHLADRWLREHASGATDLRMDGLTSWQRD